MLFQEGGRGIEIKNKTATFQTDFTLLESKKSIKIYSHTPQVTSLIKSK